MINKRVGSKSQKFLFLFVILLVNTVTGVIRIKPDTLLRRNAGLLFLNHAMAESNSSLNARQQQIANAKRLLREVDEDSNRLPATARQLNLENEEVEAQDFINLGHLWNDLGQTSIAESWYQHAIRLDPSISVPWYRLGQIYENEGQIVKAADMYQQSYILSNFSGQESEIMSEPYCRLGSYFRQNEEIRDLARAQELIEVGIALAAFESEDGKSKCYYELGNVLRWLGYPVQDYIEWYHQAVATGARFMPAYIEFGAAYYQLTSDITQAEGYLREALSIQPSMKAYQELAKIYELESRYADAIEMYHEALNFAVTDREVESIRERITELQELIYE
jgi:tetratricopeptide (TPR) repeat protein